MHQEHFHDAKQIYLPLIQMFLEQPGHERNMPGVLRIIFVPGFVHQVRLAVDRLQLVDFPDKLDLPVQTFIHE